MKVELYLESNFGQGLKDTSAKFHELLRKFANWESLTKVDMTNDINLFLYVNGLQTMEPSHLHSEAAFKVER